MKNENWYPKFALIAVLLMALAVLFAYRAISVIGGNAVSMTEARKIVEREGNYVLGEVRLYRFRVGSFPKSIEDVRDFFGVPISDRWRCVLAGPDSVLSYKVNWDESINYALFSTESGPEGWYIESANSPRQYLTSESKAD